MGLIERCQLGNWTWENDGDVLDSAQIFQIILRLGSEKHLEEVGSVAVEQRLEEAGGLFYRRPSSCKSSTFMENLSYALLTVLEKLTDTGDFIYECCVVTICNIYGGVCSWSLVNKCGAVWRRVKCGATRCFYCEVVVRSNLSSRHLSIGGGCRWLVHKEN